MKWLLDEGIPRRVATWLREQGEEVLVVAESEYRSQPDRVLWGLAGAEDRIIVTADRNFAALSTRPAPKGLVVMRPAADWRAEAIALFLWSSMLHLGFEALVGAITILQPGRVRQRPLAPTDSSEQGEG